MYAPTGGTTITVHYLTFDGNRMNTTPCAANPVAGNADLDLSNVHVATVQYVNFIRAPFNSLYLGGDGVSGAASTVSYSNFGSGFNNPSRVGYSNLTGPQTASRNNAITLEGPSTGVWHNSINYAGGVAVQDYSGSFHYIVDNNINENHYEDADGIPGGQIYFSGGNAATSYTSVANNVVNGNYWSTANAQQANPSQPNYTLCAPGYNAGWPSGSYPYGIEVSGSGHVFYNNAVIQNLGFGMFLRPWNSSQPLQNITISGYDPFCPTYCQNVPNVAHYIDSNGGCYSLYNCFPSSIYGVAGEVAGININTSAAGGSGPPGTVSGITLDHVRVRNSGRWGASFSGASGIGFTDSQNGGVNYACFSGNVAGALNTGTSGNSSGFLSFTNLCP